jgi:WD40 repeat protein
MFTHKIAKLISNKDRTNKTTSADKLGTKPSDDSPVKPVVGVWDYSHILPEKTNVFQVKAINDKKNDWWPIPREYLNCIKALPDNQLAVGGEDNYLRILACDHNGQWQCVESFNQYPFQFGVSSIELLANGNIVCGGGNGELCIFEKDDSNHWNCQSLNPQPGSSVTAICIIDDDHFLTGTHGEKGIFYWTRIDNKWSLTQTIDKDMLVNSLAKLPNDKVICGTYNGALYILEKNPSGQWTPTRVRESGSSCVNSISCFPDGKTVAVSSSKGMALYSADNFARSYFDRFFLSFTSAKILSDRLLACVSYDELSEYDVKTGIRRQNPFDGDFSIIDITASGREPPLLTIHFDGSVRAVDQMSDGRLVVLTDINNLNFYSFPKNEFKNVVENETKAVPPQSPTRRTM